MLKISKFTVFGGRSVSMFDDASLRRAVLSSKGEIKTGPSGMGALINNCGDGMKSVIQRGRAAWHRE